MQDADTKQLAFVINGRFNPAIIHPEWLVRKGIIPEGLAESAKLKIAHPEYSEFDLDYCTVQVQQARFTVLSTYEHDFPSMLELLVGILGALGETPVVQLGINVTHHFKFADPKIYHQFGHHIVPKDEFWSHILKNPGLVTIQVRGERVGGFRQVSVGMSEMFPNQGIEVGVNDHYELQTLDPRIVNAADLVTMLVDTWEQSVKDSINVIGGARDFGFTGKITADS